MAARRFLFLATAGAALVASAPAHAIDYLSVAQAAVLYDAPSAKAKPLFVIHRGTPVEQVVVVGGWVKVRDARGDLAWIEKGQLSTQRMVIVRGEKIPVSVRAYIAGDIVEVIPGEGVVVQNNVALIQGIFGVGGETHGTLKVVCASPDEPLDEKHVSPALRDCIVVGGGRMTAGAIRKAKQVGAAAVVSGGIDDHDLRDFLGHDIGVAVTGSEKLGITLIITEGFGDIAMAQRTFELMRSHDGRMASVNGATQIRAGVMRPEIVIPLEGGASGGGGSAAAAGGAVAGVLEIGTQVRIIRDPYFGLLGTVKALPEQPAVLGSGSKARVLDVALVDGRTVTVPRANVELIEG